MKRNTVIFINILLINVLLFILNCELPKNIKLFGSYTFYQADNASANSSEYLCENYKNSIAGRDTVLSAVTKSDKYSLVHKYAIRSHENKCCKIALTFDDGPSAQYTAQILDILNEYGIKATFFVIGENAARFPELIKRELDEGHEVGNHTYSHCKLSKMSETALQQDLLKTEETIYEIEDYRPALFRPPEGDINNNVVSAAQSLDYSIILWNIDTRDWAHTPVNMIAENVLTNIESGDIILFHDFIGKNSPTPAALKKIIPALLERGYNFVTVSELIGSE